MKSTLKCIYIIIGLTLSHYAYAASDSEDDSYFESRNYIIHIDTSKCKEGSSECDVTYHGINKHNHHEITIKGTTLNIGTSLIFSGYIFHNGKYIYSLIPLNDPEGEKPRRLWGLEVDLLKSRPQDFEILVEEKGKWVYPK